MTKFAGGWAVLVVLLASACASYTTSRSEVYLRYDAAEDALLILERERGIQSEHGLLVPDACTDLLAAVHGARRYPPAGGFLHVDFDQAMQDTWSPEERARFREFSSHVQVEESHLVQDPGSGLGFVRRTRISGLSTALPLVNAWLNRLGEPDTSPAEAAQLEFPAMDEATAAAWKQARAGGHAWLAVRDGAIELDLPTTPRNAALCLAYLAGSDAQDDLAPLFENCAAVSITEGHVQLRFGEQPVPLLRFASAERETEVDKDLVHKLAHAGVRFEKEAVADALVQHFLASTSVEPGSSVLH